MACGVVCEDAPFVVENSNVCYGPRVTHTCIWRIFLCVIFALSVSMVKSNLMLFSFMHVVFLVSMFLLFVLVGA